MRISDWSSDVCSSDLLRQPAGPEDEAGDLGDALLGLQVGEDEGPLAAHLFRIAVHHFQRRADQRREIDLVDHQQRSEERRVGNECVRKRSSRGSPDHQKKKQYNTLTTYQYNEN